MIPSPEQGADAVVPDLSRVTLGAIFDPLERGERCGCVAILYH